MSSSPLLYPRPEYPRPDRQRSFIEGIDWLNLNGPWQFRFDGERRGVDEHWFRPDQSPWRQQIIVPFCWESLAAWGEGDAAGNDNYYSTRVYLNPLEVTRENHRSARRYEVGWYRREIFIPENPHWRDKRVILTIGAADFYTDCWCNGVHLGRHEGGYVPFEFDLSDTLQMSPDGRRVAHLVLRVEDPMDNHEQPVGKQWRWYTTTSGIWQTVFVEPRSSNHIGSFRILPDIDRQIAEFEVLCVTDTPSGALEVEITPPGGEKMTASVALNASLATIKIPIDPLFLWNPNEPYLYRTVLRLRQDGQPVDTVHTYFGMRKIDAAPSDDPEAPAVLRLNGVARYLRGALYQSYYPEGVYTAGDVRTIRNDILYAKRVGFNFLRIHIKLDDPLLLYCADTLGILLMTDFPNFGEGGDTQLGRQRFEDMMREGIKRDFNHPAIIAWCLFNETWGFGGQLEFVELFTQPKTAQKSLALSAIATEETVKKEQKAKLANLSSHLWVQKTWELAKQLDPTRLIEDMSVVHWEHLDYFLHGDTDINSWHFYMHDYAKAKAHIEKIVNSTFVGSTFNYVEGYRQKSQPLINSEYGGVGALDGDRDVSWSFKFLTNELRRHGKISAYIYTQLHDVEWEFNGFLNYDRTPKQFGYDPATINESDFLPVDSPPASRRQPGEIVHLPVSSSHYSTKKHENVTLRWRLAGVDTLGRIHNDLVSGTIPIRFPHRRVEHAHTIELKMPASAILCTLLLDAITAEGQIVARNFVEYFVTSGYPPIRESEPGMVVLRAVPGEWDSSFWSNYAATREEERARDCSYGSGNGFFEWHLPLDGVDFSSVRRLRVLCEASSRRIDNPQTDSNMYPTTLQIQLNGVIVHQATIPNHPHDSRGVLSQLRGDPGGYGYLVHVTAEGQELREVKDHVADGVLRLKCAVPAESLVQGGLSIYGAESGRFPVCPAVILEW